MNPISALRPAKLSRRTTTPNGREGQRKRVTALFSFLALVLLLSVPVALAANSDPRVTGTVRPTDEQWNWGETHLLKAQHIRLNRLGLERVNGELKKHGKRAVAEANADLAPVGAEVTGTTAVEPEGTTPAATAPAGMPSGVDNSTLKYFPPIRSQGALGSCAQFSAVYYTLTHMTAMARDWDAKNGGDQFRFSPKWTYNMVNGGNDAGSWHYDAYAIARKHGLATWAEFPYDSDYRGWCLNPDVWRNAINVRADQSGKVMAVNTDAGLSQLKQLLLNGYVLNYATYVNSWTWRTISDDPASTADDALVGKSCAVAVNGESGGHSMTIVGYNDDIWVDINGDGVVDAGEKGALRIANSWGTEWYEGGFCWMSYQALRTPNPAMASESIFWYNEATWVTARSSYSPKLLAEFRLNHARRNQLAMTLGTSAVGGTTPTIRWYPSKVLSLAGGTYAFDGTTTPVSATFYLDLTDLAPTVPGPLRYFLGTSDSATGDIATLESFRLIDLSKGESADYPSVPETTDGSQLYSDIDYDNSTATLPPVAVVVAAPVTGTVPLPVSFDGSGSAAADGTLGTIATYEWTFGDGVSGAGITVDHTYASAGTFTATLTVTDDLGGKDTASVVINATAPPVAVIAATPVSGTVPLPVNFDASGSYAPAGSIVTYAWTFGDGTTGAGGTVSHTYAAAGSYTATLTVTDDRGASDTASVVITVTPPVVLTAPSGLTAKPLARVVTLKWADNSTNESGFYVERAVKTGKVIGVYARVSTSGPNVVLANNTVPAKGTYYYRVQAFNSVTGQTTGYTNTVTVIISR